MSSSSHTPHGLDSVASAIERYLLDRRAWVPDQEIATRFGVRERQLRALDGSPGLASAFSISSDAGLKHVACATTEEWLHFKRRIRKHGIGELRRVRDLDRRRTQVTREHRSGGFVCEHDTGQGLLDVDPFSDGSKIFSSREG
jgi:hypothetical protein